MFFFSAHMPVEKDQPIFVQVNGPMVVSTLPRRRSMQTSLRIVSWGSKAIRRSSHAECSLEWRKIRRNRDRKRRKKRHFRKSKRKRRRRKTESSWTEETRESHERQPKEKEGRVKIRMNRSLRRRRSQGERNDHMRRMWWTMFRMSQEIASLRNKATSLW